MVFLGEGAVGLTDLVLRRIFGHAEHLIRIFVHSAPSFPSDAINYTKVSPQMCESFINVPGQNDEKTGSRPDFRAAPRDFYSELQNSMLEY